MTSALALTRAALAGAATGARSTAAIAACAWTGPASRGRIDRWLHTSSGRRAATLAAAGELIGDKLPVTPARTEAPGLGARLAVGAVAAGVLAGRRGESVLLAAVVGTAASAATTFGGVRLRALAADRLGGDLPGALAEDVVALSFAGAAVRLP